MVSWLHQEKKKIKLENVATETKKVFADLISAKFAFKLKKKYQKLWQKALKCENC